MTALTSILTGVAGGQYKWIATAIVAVAIFGSGCAVGFGLRGVIANAAESKLREDHATAMQTISDTAAQAATDALAIQHQLANKIAAIDAARTEEIERAKIENEKLRADIRAGTRRLSVAARCPASGNRLSGDAAGSSVGHGSERAEIDPATADRIVRIANDGDAAIRQLTACQDYARAINLQSGK
jgi:prophage endopeptidase